MIVTSDNPRSEDPEAIIAEIVARRRAGRRAGRGGPPRGDRAARSSSAAPGDVVVIAGKGHEQGQEFAGGREVPFDDVDGRPRGAACATWSPEHGRPAPRAARLRRAGGGRGRGGPAARRRSTRARPGPATCSSGFVGERADGGAFARAGARGRRLGRRSSAPEHAEARSRAVPGAVLAADDPLAALQRLATAWRRELGCPVVGITGSTGKTSTKDILRGDAAPQRRDRRQPRRTQHRDRAAADACSARRSAPRRSCSRWRCAARARSPSWPRSPQPDVGVIVASARSTSSCSGRSRRSRRPRPS